MGTFQVKIKITSIDDTNFSKALEIEVWADNGATFTQIPRAILERLGIKPIRTEIFTLANGSSIDRQIGLALLLVEGKKTGDEVTFGEEGDSSLLGATTLEHTGFLIDPQLQRLVPRGAIIQY